MALALKHVSSSSKTDRTLICICGHSLGTHHMVGTEYARCQPSTGVRCYCTGGDRAVVRLLDVRIGGRGAAWTGGLKTMEKSIKVYQDGRYITALDWGLHRLREKGLSYAWISTRCDVTSCSRPFLGDTDVHVRMVGAEGEILHRLSRAEDYTGRFILICGTCDIEMRYRDGK